MRNHEFFASCVEAETPIFLRVLRALPAEKLDYKPHERNTPAGVLAAQVAREMASLIHIFDNGTIDYNDQTPMESLDEIVALFERSAKTVAERARTAGEAVWKGPGKFIYNGRTAWEAPQASQIAWGFLFDLIHHRGQLSVYIRPMGGKVPAIYGPSGDDRG